MSELIVSMDGPSGTGKSTVSKAVADRMGLPHLDTGAFYRAATLAVLRSEVDLEDDDAVVAEVEQLTMDQASGRMYLDGEDISDEIRGERVTKAVSRVSAIPAVRARLVGMQRQWVAGRGGRAVVEGRDVGSVVFPNATLKIYLDASPAVRAQRRALQAGEDLEETIADIKRRDHADSTREASPLSVPDGATIVDTSDLTFDEVVDQVVALIRSSP